MIQLFALQMSFTNNYKRVTSHYFKKSNPIQGVFIVQTCKIEKLHIS